jgi:hypothetical protein
MIFVSYLHPYLDGCRTKSDQTGRISGFREPWYKRHGFSRSSCCALKEWLVMTRSLILALYLALLVPIMLIAQSPPSALQQQVRDRELAFAKTMADRDHAAFTSFVSAVAEGWKRFFEGPQAPFSWEPERVEVTDSGTLAISSGPVRDPSGQRTGTFVSTWRREADGQWRIVLDTGCPPCRP